MSLTPWKACILSSVRSYRASGVELANPTILEACYALEEQGLVTRLLDHGRDWQTDKIHQRWLATEYLSPSCGPLVPGARP